MLGLPIDLEGPFNSRPSSIVIQQELCYGQSVKLDKACNIAAAKSLVVGTCVNQIIHGSRGLFTYQVTKSVGEYITLEGNEYKATKFTKAK